MATAELYVSPHLVFQENSKLPPAHGLIRAVCNDQTFLFQHFANPEQQFAVVCVRAPPHSTFTSAINR